MTQDTIQQEIQKKILDFDMKFLYKLNQIALKNLFPGLYADQIEWLEKSLESIATTAREEERRNIAYNIESFLKCFPHLTLQEYAERTKLFTNNKT